MLYCANIFIFESHSVQFDIADYLTHPSTKTKIQFYMLCFILAPLLPFIGLIEANCSSVYENRPLVLPPKENREARHVPLSNQTTKTNYYEKIENVNFGIIGNCIGKPILRLMYFNSFLKPFFHVNSMAYTTETIIFQFYNATCLYEFWMIGLNIVIFCINEYNDKINSQIDSILRLICIGMTFISVSAKIIACDTGMVVRCVFKKKKLLCKDIDFCFLFFVSCVLLLLLVCQMNLSPLCIVFRHWQISICTTMEIIFGSM